MKRETLKKVDKFLSFGDIRVIDENEYRLTDKAVQKIIKGYENEIKVLKQTGIQNESKKENC